MHMAALARVLTPTPIEAHTYVSKHTCTSWYTLCLCKSCVHTYQGHKREDKGSFQKISFAFFFTPSPNCPPGFFPRRILLLCYSDLTPTVGTNSHLKISKRITSDQLFLPSKGHLQFPEFNMWSALMAGVTFHHSCEEK